MAILLCSVESFAAHPLVTDDAGTIGKRAFQAELNTEFSADKERDDGITTKEHVTETATILTYGASEDIDIVLGLPYQWIRVKEDGDVTTDVDGISDLSLEIKWRFFEKDGTGLALKPGITLPTGDEEKGLGNGRISFYRIKGN
jgi:hypothetical protein